MDGRKRIVVGVVGLLGLGILAQQAPGTASALLMSFALIVFVVALIGFIKPSVVNIPDRLAAIWLLAVAFGCYLGGAALLSPPNGNSVASDALFVEAGPPTAMDSFEARERAARERRVAAMERQAAERLAAGQLSVDPNRRSAPSSGADRTAPAAPNRDDRTRWQNPEPWLAAVCSPTLLNVRACFGVTEADGQRVVLIESNLHLLRGDPVSVSIDGLLFTERAEQDMGNVVWTGTEADRLIAALRAGDEAIITHADGVEFRVGLDGSAAAISRALR